MRIEIVLQGAQEPLDFLPPDPLALQRLTEVREDLPHPAVEGFLVHLADTGDVRNREFDPQFDEKMVVARQGVEGPLETHVHPATTPLSLLLQEELVRRKIPRRLGLERIFADLLPGNPVRELGPKLGELRHGHLNPLVRPQDLTGLLKGVPVADHQHLQADSYRTQPLCLGGRVMLPPNVVLVVEERPLDDHREIGLQSGPLVPPELPDHGVVIVDELAEDLSFEIFSFLGAKVGSPAALGDDRLDGLQILEEGLLGGAVARRGGHRGRCDLVFGL